MWSRRCGPHSSVVPCVRFDALPVDGPAPDPGRVIEQVACRRRVLDIVWDDGFVLHSRIRWGGAWHVYRDGEPWRRPSDRMGVAITVAGWVAVCFAPAEVETFRELDAQRHPAFGGCAPDVAAARRRPRAVPRPAARPRGSGRAGRRGAARPARRHRHRQRVPQRGAVPLRRAPVGGRRRARPRTSAPASCARAADAVRATAEAAQRDRRRSTPASRCVVYGRNGQRCGRCGDTVRVDRRRPAAAGLLVRRLPDRRTTRWPLRRKVHEAPMDPHPAADRYTADLPWRRAAG